MCHSKDQGESNRQGTSGAPFREECEETYTIKSYDGLQWQWQFLVEAVVLSVLGHHRHSLEPARLVDRYGVLRRDCDHRRFLHHSRFSFLGGRRRLLRIIAGLRGSQAASGPGIALRVRGSPHPRPHPRAQERGISK